MEKKIEGLLKEADIYTTQGLFDEARAQLEAAASYLSQNRSSLGDKADELQQAILDRQNALEDEIKKVETATRAPEMSDEFQEVVKEVFTFSEDDDKAALEGAVALVQFGQFKRALKELVPLLDRDRVKFMAAKNILRCYIALDEAKTASEMYNRWIDEKRFSSEELKQLKEFLSRSITEKKASAKKTDKSLVQKKKVVLPDIHSVEINMDMGMESENTADYKVVSQSGDNITFVVPCNEETSKDIWDEGALLNEVRCYSQASLFIGKGVLLSVRESEHGAGKELLVSMEVS